MKSTFSRVLLLITLFSCTAKFNAQLSSSPTLAVSNVTEASQYGVLYQLNIPTSAVYSSLSSILYSINNSSLTLNYPRVAYFLQLDNKWVWVSMNAFNTTNAQLGVPFNNSGIIWQQTVSGMNVYSSVGAGVTNTTGINGNIEIWPDCYSTGAALGGIGGNGGTYDFNDTRNPSSNCYGSFQVHNYGASETIFAMNDFLGTNNIDLGIGNNIGNSNPDWTFMYNAPSYTSARKLWVLVYNDLGFVNQPSTLTSSACVNATLSALTVSAAVNSATIANYTWYSNTTPAITGGTLVATHTTSLTTDSYTPSTATPGTLYYYCVLNGTGSTGTLSSVSDVSGGITTVTNPTLTVTGTGSICAGGSISLSAASSIGAVTYTWSGGQNTSGILVTPSVTTNYSVSGTSSLGCVAGSSIVTVTVSALPVISVTNGTICNGGSFVFAPSGASTYTYSGGLSTVAPVVTTNYTVTGTDLLGCVGTNTAVSVVVNTVPIVSITGTTSICSGSSASLTANGAATYTWSTNSNASGISVSPTSNTSYSLSGTSSQGCVSSSSAVTTVTVNALPIIGITGANTVCAGSSVALTAGGASTYTWNTGSNASIITVTPTGNTSYSVSGTSVNGCVSSASAVTTVSVNILPVISITGTTSICNGASTSFTAGGASTYTWNTSSNATVLSVSPSSNTSYSVSGTSSAGCISSAPAIISLTVNALPLVSITGSTSICAGSSTSLTASGASTYSWTGLGSTTLITVTPAVNTNYTVTGTSSLGCIGLPVVSNVTVNALPIINITGANTVCAGSSVALTAGGASTYSWNTGSNASAITVTPTGLTSYSVSGTSVNGCVSSASAVTTVSVYVLPLVSITAGTTTACAGASTSFTANGAATYTWNTSSNATVISVSPTSNTVYSVSGTSSLGCVSATSAVLSFSVNALPTLSITGTPLTMCAGAAASLIANGAATYTWVGIGTNTIIGGPLSVTTSYTLTGTSSLGCVGVPVVRTITVNPLPTIAITGTSAICAGSTTSLTASGGNTYTWTGLGSSTVIAISPVFTTIYTVTGTSTTGCTNFATKTVTANALPSLTISGSSGICTGQNASLTVSGASTYSWSTGSTNTAIVTTPASNTIYTVTGTDVLGCVKTSTQLVTVAASLSISIAGPTVVCLGQSFNLGGVGGATYTWNTNATTSSISPSPTVTTTYSVIGASGTCSNTALTTVVVNPNPTVTIAGLNAICSGNSSTLTASGATTYSWTNASTTSTVVLSPTVTTGYSVTGQYTTGCSSTVGNIITVYSLPTVSIVGSTMVCAGSNAILIAGGATTYTWNTGANTSTISPTNSGTYSAAGTDANGCINSSPATTLIVNPVPTLSISSSATVICAGDAVTLTVSGATTYTWNGGATTPTITDTPGFTTTYTVTGTNTFACSSSNVILVTVNPLPLIAITGPTMICKGETALLNASGAATYTWGTANTSSSLTVTPTLSTTYSITGSSASGCLGSSSMLVTVSDCTGLNFITASNKISVYPNPTNGNFSIELVDAVDATITIRNVLGQLIINKKAELINNIQLNEFNNGMYYITITKNNAVVYSTSVIKN